MIEHRCVVCNGRVFGDQDRHDLNDALRVYLCWMHRHKATFEQDATGRWLYYQDAGPVHALGWPEN